jgi:hypothetical protein
MVAREVVEKDGGTCARERWREREVAATDDGENGGETAERGKWRRKMVERGEVV